MGRNSAARRSNDGAPGSVGYAYAQPESMQRGIDAGQLIATQERETPDPRDRLTALRR